MVEGMVAMVAMVRVVPVTEVVTATSTAHMRTTMAHGNGHLATHTHHTTPHAEGEAIGLAVMWCWRMLAARGGAEAARQAAVGGGSSSDDGNGCTVRLARPRGRGGGAPVHGINGRTSGRVNERARRELYGGFYSVFFFSRAR